nr:PREDICTED: acylphosphatase-1 [Apteryx mantelli mantelli]
MRLLHLLEAARWGLSQKSLAEALPQSWLMLLAAFSWGLSALCAAGGFVLHYLSLISPCSAFSSQAEGKRLGLVGWVKNTSHGTVQGQLQGPTANVQELQEWLRKTGSPQSCISRVEFHNEKKIEALEHKDFVILK